MATYVPGAPNTNLHLTKQQAVEERVSEKGKFHHSSLAGDDDELAGIEQIHGLLPYVFCSSRDIATNMHMLLDGNRRVKFPFVLNVSPSGKDKLTLENMRKMGITHEQYLCENVPDWVPPTEVRDPKDQLHSFVDVAKMSHAFIKRAVSMKRNILIHDDQGTSTAPAVVIAYLLREFYAQAKPTKNMLPIAVRDLKIKRPCIDINMGFLEALEDLEAQLSGRPVLPQQSLSIRRNAQLKAHETAKIAEAVAQERAHADKTWGKNQGAQKLLADADLRQVRL